MSRIYQIVKEPIVTEKSSALKAEANKVVFHVDRSANKVEIREAIEKLFDVKVEGVHTSITRGKPKRVGRSVGRRQNWKKAVVTLAEGTDLDVFGTVEAAATPEE